MCIRICFLLYLYLRISFTQPELWPLSAISATLSTLHLCFNDISLKWVFAKNNSGALPFCHQLVSKVPLFSCLGSKSSARPQNRQFAFLRSHTRLLWITNNGHSGNKMVLLAQLVHLQVTSINETAKSSLEWFPSI